MKRGICRTTGRLCPCPSHWLPAESSTRANALQEAADIAASYGDVYGVGRNIAQKILEAK